MDARTATVRPNDARPEAGRGVTPACAAPFVAMEFDQFGDVQACCANALYPLGNVAESSLHDIWHGERARKLRAALLRGDLSYGCGVCRHRLDAPYGEMPRDYYDNFPLTSIDPDWPYSLQFSLHNTCNLECVMCGADRSSKIRSRRSHLEPLPHAYDDRFFEQLEPFLAHCGAADFSGGEPFLVAEHYRVWDLLAELDHRPLCSLTTNGTVWNERTESVLDRLDLHISVSIDGMTPATLESIRVGTDHAVVFANLERFRAYTRARGTQLTVTWSLLRQNWFELGAMLRFAEERGIPVKVQTVMEREFGVQCLPTPELERVVESLDAESRTLEPDLSLNLGMWRREVERLRGELVSRRQPGPRPLLSAPPDPSNRPHIVEMIGRTTGRTSRLAALDRRARDRVVERSRRDLQEWSDAGAVGELLVTDDGVLLEAQPGPLTPHLGSGAVGPGTTLHQLLAAIESELDAALWISEETVEPDRLLQTLWFGRRSRDKAGLVVRLVTVPDGDRRRVLVAVDDRFLPPAPSGVSVTLSARPAAAR